MLNYATQPVEKGQGHAWSNGGSGRQDSCPSAMFSPLPTRKACNSALQEPYVFSAGPMAFTRAPWILVILKLHLPLKDLCHLVLVEDEAGMIVAQDSHDAQAQAGGVAAHQI